MNSPQKYIGLTKKDSAMDKKNKVRKTLISLVNAILPPLIFSLIKHYYPSHEDDVITIVAPYIITIVFVFLLNICIFENSRFFRRYRKFEGKWLQITPGFIRPITICTLEYMNGQYHFHGDSYHISKDGTIDAHIPFFSHRFIEDTDSSFCYVTNAEDNGTYRKIEGFGRVYNLSQDGQQPHTASGFFFDTTIDILSAAPSMHYTKMIQLTKESIQTVFGLNSRIINIKNLVRLPNEEILKQAVKNTNGFLSQHLQNDHC